MTLPDIIKIKFGTNLNAFGLLPKENKCFAIIYNGYWLDNLYSW